MYAGLAVLSKLRSLRLVAPCAPARTVAAGLEEGLAGLTALQELSLALHSTIFTVGALNVNGRSPAFQPARPSVAFRTAADCQLQLLGRAMKQGSSISMACDLPQAKWFMAADCRFQGRRKANSAALMLAVCYAQCGRVSALCL